MRLFLPVLGILLLLAGCATPPPAAMPGEGELEQIKSEKAALAEELAQSEARVAELEELLGEAAEPPPAIWTEEGLEYQPRMTRFSQAAKAHGYEPGTTDWKRATIDLPAEFTAAGGKEWTAPGILLAALAPHVTRLEGLGEELGEVTLRARETGDGAAAGLILSWGFKDDAMQGHDYRVTLAGGPGKWYVTEVQERYHCSRGVDASGRCV